MAYAQHVRNVFNYTAPIIFSIEKIHTQKQVCAIHTIVNKVERISSYK